jgi:hypothetical protein
MQTYCTIKSALFFQFTILFGLCLGLLVVLPIASADSHPAGYAPEFDRVNGFVELARTADMLGSGWESKKTVNLWVLPTGPSPS